MYRLAPVEPVVPIPMFDVAMSVRVFVVPETFTLVVKMLDTVRAFVTYMLPMTYRLVVPGCAPIPMLDRATTFTMLAVLATFKFVPKIEEPFRVVTLVVDRLETDVTLRVGAKRLAAFMIAALLLV